MARERSSGILLHPTSLPGPYGVGDVGPGAERWLDWLAGTGCSYWQVLPLGPTGFSDSPYFCFSAFAGNPYLVSPERLLESGLIEERDLAGRADFPTGRVDFGRVIPWKLGLLDRAFDRFRDDAPPGMPGEYAAFRAAQSGWLDDYTLFMALKEEHGGGPWSDWPDPLRFRHPEALSAASVRLGDEVERQAFRQFIFFRQWAVVKQRAGQQGIRILGDIPMYVAGDSADVWANPHLFDLNEDRRPRVVAGVPPDYFTETGQLWGNPLYHWTRHAEDGFAWWIARLRTLLGLVDEIRIDHFRAFVNYWEVPAGATTAEHGRWVWGPGEAFFDTVSAALGGLPIVAEDLGELHPEVPRLLETVGLPGMKILQFAFDGDPDNAFLPENFSENCIVYTGTHDNDTAVGWYDSLDRRERKTVRRILGVSGRTIAWALIEEAWASPAYLAVTPLQDLLGLGPVARMNRPGTLSGDNWTWRLTPGSVTTTLQDRLRDLNRRTARR